MIIFLYGEDTFRSRQKLKELKNKFSRDIDSLMLNIENLNGEKISPEDFELAINSGGFLVKKRMIIIENLMSRNKNKETLKKIFKKIKKIKDQETAEANNNIIIFWEELGSSNKNYGGKKIKGELYRYLKKEKYASEFLPLDNILLARWIKKTVNLKGKDIKSEAVNMLISLVDGDMWKLKNELDKLIVGDDKLIEVSKIKETVSEKFSDNIFELTDSIANRNKKIFLSLLGKNLKAGVDTSYLFSMLVRQFRMLLCAKSMLNDNPYINLSAELKIPFFVEKKVKLQASAYSLEQLKNIYALLVDIDVRLKTGYINSELLFYKLISVK